MLGSRVHWRGCTMKNRVEDMHVVEFGKPVEIFSGACRVFDQCEARLMKTPYAYANKNRLRFEDDGQAKTELKKYLSSIEELVEALSIAL